MKQMGKVKKRKVRIPIPNQKHILVFPRTCPKADAFILKETRTLRYFKSSYMYVTGQPSELKLKTYAKFPALSYHRT